MEEITLCQNGETLLAKFTGELTLEVTQRIKSDFEKSFDSANFRILAFDMSEVTFMDSSGIGFLVSCNSRMQSQGKSMRIFRPSTQIRKTLELVQLTKYFTFVEDESELEAT